MYSRRAVEKRRLVRLKNEREKRENIIREASKSIRAITKKDLFYIGVDLYWAEGSKTKRGSVEFSNSDPNLIKIMKEFFNEVCHVPQEKYRGHVYLHPHLDVKKAEQFWSKVAAIPRSQFFKTSQQHNRASKGKKDSLPYGTFAVGIYDVKLFLKIKGWMRGIHENIF